jgi:hypothetical protein
MSRNENVQRRSKPRRVVDVVIFSDCLSAFSSF